MPRDGQDVNRPEEILAQEVRGLGKQLPPAVCSSVEDVLLQQNDGQVIKKGGVPRRLPTRLGWPVALGRVNHRPPHFTSSDKDQGVSRFLFSLDYALCQAGEVEPNLTIAWATWCQTVLR